MSECVARVWDFRISRLEFANLRKPDEACYDFYSVCLCCEKFPLPFSVKQIRLLNLLRISSGENNQKSKRNDPSKISLAPAVGALEILGAWAWGFFYFRKPDISANQFSDFTVKWYCLCNQPIQQFFPIKIDPHKRVYREGIIHAIPLYLHGILLVSLIFLCSFLWRN